jgi:drug/metabolite transporter (DMT)-like permease
VSAASAAPGARSRSDRLSILAALAAALLFGASTPLAKRLLGEVSPVLLAAMLYLGSGIGLWGTLLLRADRGARIPRWSIREWGWFAGAAASGGLVGPVLLMVGLARTPAADASLLLNLESVFTALLAWVAFREHTDRRVLTGMLLIVCGGALLSWPASWTSHALLGPLAIAGACLCWGLDNNLTRKVSAGDAWFIAGTKGLVAGLGNLAVALGLGAVLPAPAVLAQALVLGFLAYGVSLVLFVLALRGLGAARTGAYFSTAPFLGAAIAITWLHEPLTVGFMVAALLMLAGVWLHLTERHEHSHTHESAAHTHAHRHDEHHQHQHAFAWDGRDPHTHEHRHEHLTHSHPHYPDVHHQHGH